MTIKELKEHLNNYPENMPVAYSLWLPADVISVANDLKPPLVLAEHEIIEVMEIVNDHDAEDGINWYTIKSAINLVKQIED